MFAFSGCGHYFHNIHHHVHSRLNSQHIAVLYAKSRFSRSWKRLPSICSSRSHLHVMVHIWIPGMFDLMSFWTSRSFEAPGKNKRGLLFRLYSGSVTLSSRDLNPWLPAIILRLFNYWIIRCIQALRCHLVCLDTNLLNGKIVCPNQLNTIAEYTSNCNGTKQKLGFSKQHNKDQLINRIASMRYSTSLQ